jgi:hypothetical protein
MVKLIETATMKSGEVKTSEKSFSSMIAFRKCLTQSKISAKVKYDLFKTGASEVFYDDATVVLKVIDDKAKAKLLNMFGKPVDD